MSAANIKTYPFSVDLTLDRIDPWPEFVKTLPTEQEQIDGHADVTCRSVQFLPSLDRFIFANNSNIQIAICAVVSSRPLFVMQELRSGSYFEAHGV